MNVKNIFAILTVFFGSDVRRLLRTQANTPS